MNLFQLVLKNMRQRALGTCLTLLSVVLGVALAISVMILLREGDKLFGQSDYGFDVLIGAKGSPLQLTLNTIYHIDRSPGNIPYSLYEAMSTKYRAEVRRAIPFAVGDSYKNHRIVGTSPRMFGGTEDGSGFDPKNAFEFRKDRKYALAEGKSFHPAKFEAVVGWDVSTKTGLKMGDTFQATHGTPSPDAINVDIHDEQWTVVGVLERTNTASDRVIYIPILTFYTIAEHDDGIQAIHGLNAGQSVTDIASVKAPVVAAKDEHDHDHAHDHAAPATTQATADHADHDHDHDHDHTGHDHAAPTTAQATDAHADHDHDRAAPSGGLVTSATSPTPDPQDDHDHGHGHDHHGHDHEKNYTLNADGTIELSLPKEDWLISAILVEARGPFQTQSLMYAINNRNEAAAVNPASVMREFFQLFLEPSGKVLLLVSGLVTFVASVSVLVSIYNSVSARMREIAILRALGATRARILTLICVEAGLIGLVGGLLGLVAGHLLGALGSRYMQQAVGEGIDWLHVAPEQWIYLGAVVMLAVMAGLVPALKAYRVPVATNLVAN